MKKKTNIPPTSPVGIFDSGLGGLSIWKEIKKKLPNESCVYLADSKNAPYGEKSKQEIIDFGVKNTQLLLELGCKIIVVACNTATTNSISILRKKFDVPFIGIEPATKTAALTSKTGKIGILATQGTLKSDLFITTSNQYRKQLEIFEAEGKGLVKLIELGRLNETEELLRMYLNPMVKKGIDHLVLGCTHYPFLSPIIQKIIPKTITLIDSGEAVANQTEKILKQYSLLNSNNKIGKDIFYTNHDLIILDTFMKQMGINNPKTKLFDF